MTAERSDKDEREREPEVGSVAGEPVDPAEQAEPAEQPVAATAADDLVDSDTDEPAEPVGHGTESPRTPVDPDTHQPADPLEPAAGEAATARAHPVVEEPVGSATDPTGEPVEPTVQEPVDPVESASDAATEPVDPVVEEPVADLEPDEAPTADPVEPEVGEAAGTTESVGPAQPTVRSIEQEPTAAQDGSAATGAPTESAEPPAPVGADQPADVIEPAKAASLADSYPGEYVPSDAPPPEIERPHESPERWADAVNPDKDGPGRDNNCGECSRVSETDWRGEPSVAAAMADPEALGEPTARMSDWAGGFPHPTSIDALGNQLADLGPGSSAIVGCEWEDGEGAGHWFNAVNDGGDVKAVDGQSGAVELWPPSNDGLGFSAEDMRTVDALVYNADGDLVK